MSLTKELLDRWEKQLLSAVRADMDAKDVLELIGLARAGLISQSRIEALEAEIKIMVEALQYIGSGVKWNPESALKREANSRREAALEALSQCPIANSLTEKQK